MIDNSSISRSGKNRFGILGIALALVAAGALAGCLSDDGGSDSKSLTMVVPAWTGEEIRTFMVQKVLTDELGYSVDIKSNVEVGAAYQSVASDNADIFVGAWLPIQQAQYEKVQNDLVYLTENLEGEDVTFNFAVPQYVIDAGVTSFTDLAANKDKFGGKFYGLDPGAGMSITADEKIAKDLYGLGDWEYVAASEAAMLSQYNKAVENDEWVIIAAWSPHYMFAKWQGDDKLNYLEDPGDPEHGGETFYQDSSDETVVATLVSNNLADNHPDAKAFLENFKMNPDHESELMLRVNAGESTKEVALDYVDTHPEVVEAWLAGVNTEA